MERVTFVYALLEKHVVANASSALDLYASYRRILANVAHTPSLKF